MSDKVGFVDIMEPRHLESGIFSYMTRSWRPKTTMVLEKYYTPQELKDIVAKSVYLNAVIESECERTGVKKEKLCNEVFSYLEEMGFEKKMCVIRWMGVFFLKMCFMMKIKLFVNEPMVLKMKSAMGNNPVLFLPTHRSYADFCLMTYLCYHYDIDLPTVAAGMDFYSMAVIGRRMRETCAFYIRRTLVGAPLYAATLKQYVRTVVANHCAPIEFFLEGTRSRSNKSLPPKYGILSMSLMPFFAREVSDITVVPINISYDRLIEHGLFAYEHLGVPKPKESTGGFLKALRNLNDHFGNIYINLGDPISVGKYLQDNNFHSKEILKPVDMQLLTPDQFKLVQSVGEYVVSQQQECTVAAISNLMALVLMQSLISNQPLVIDEVMMEINWMIKVLRKLGAKVFENDIKRDVDRILVVHRKMMVLDRDRKLRLVAEALMDVSSDVKKKMKGHILNAETMATAIPIIQLQLYVNPILHYIVPPALINLIVHKGHISEEQLAEEYRLLRLLLSNEFYYLEKTEDNKFNKALEYCIENHVISDVGGLLAPGTDVRLQHLLKWTVWPALTTIHTCAEILTERSTCEHKLALKLVQQRVESSQYHPYCLSLDATANCLQGLIVAGALLKHKSTEENIYQVVPDIMERCCNLVRSVLPCFNVPFGRSNTVVLDQRGVSRL